MAAGRLPRASAPRGSCPRAIRRKRYRTSITLSFVIPIARGLGIAIRPVLVRAHFLRPFDRAFTLLGLMFGTLPLNRLLAYFALLRELALARFRLRLWSWLLLLTLLD